MGAAAGSSATAGATPPPSWASARAAAHEQRRAAREERRAWRREHRDPTGPLVFGLILILVGGFFLVREYLPTIDLGNAWPVLLVVIGVVLLLGSFRRSSGTPS
jgi:hypothetical protein